MAARMSSWGGASESGVYAPDLFRGLIPAASPSRKMDHVTDLLHRRCVITDSRPRAEFVIQQPAQHQEESQLQRPSHGSNLPKVVSNRPASAQLGKVLTIKNPEEEQNDLLKRTVERLDVSLASELSLADLAMELANKPPKVYPCEIK